jgi:hypothetical protein
VNYHHVLCFSQFYLLCLRSSHFFFLYFSIIPTHSCYMRFIVQLCKTFLHNITQDPPSITLLPPFLSLIVLQVSCPLIIFLRPCIKRAILVNEHFRNKLRDRDSKKNPKGFLHPLQTVLILHSSVRSIQGSCKVLPCLWIHIPSIKLDKARVILL